MFLDIHELQRQKIAFEESFLPGRIDFGEEVRQVEALSVQGLAEVVASDIHLRGVLRTTVEMPCARCLEPTRCPVEMEFDLFYNPIATIARAEEAEIKTADLEVGFYHGDGLWLEDAAREQVLLSVPMKSICRSDCAGLCPQCGQNRNFVQCGCHPPLKDSRWAPLAKFQIE
ncbi:MAG: DUF177 domain-containing protein [Acidobacteria bacterium]|nr:DUF177 domain-containing protein [Acidobacteriota bacterium]